MITAHPSSGPRGGGNKKVFKKREFGSIFLLFFYLSFFSFFLFFTFFVPGSVFFLYVPSYSSTANNYNITLVLLDRAEQERAKEIHVMYAVTSKTKPWFLEMITEHQKKKKKKRSARPHLTQMYVTARRSGISQIHVCGLNVGWVGWGRQCVRQCVCVALNVTYVHVVSNACCCCLPRVTHIQA